MHVPELIRMGATIQREAPTAVIHGGKPLSGVSGHGAPAALVLAALCAKGQTEINRVYHIDRATSTSTKSSKTSARISGG
ncbi:MAG: hypothetical protein R3F11_09130 [Verrucomicrobiales bacterium]